jgi:cbb3-type cytochrome oxidase maturation protein
MEVIFVLIVLSLLVAAGFLFAFFWAIRNGQYDDSYTPSIRVLFDDGTKSKNTDSEKNKLKENKTLDQ